MCISGMTLTGLGEGQLALLELKTSPVGTPEITDLPSHVNLVQDILAADSKGRRFGSGPGRRQLRALGIQRGS